MKIENGRTVSEIFDSMSLDECVAALQALTDFEQLLKVGGTVQRNILKEQSFEQTRQSFLLRIGLLYATSSAGSR